MFNNGVFSEIFQFLDLLQVEDVQGNGSINKNSGHLFVQAFEYLMKLKPRSVMYILAPVSTLLVLYSLCSQKPTCSLTTTTRAACGC